VESEKDVSDGEIVSEESTASDQEEIDEPKTDGVEKVAQLTSPPEPKQTADSGESTRAQTVSDNQPGSKVPVTTGNDVGVPAGVETSFKARRAKVRRRRALRSSLAKAGTGAAQDPDRISGVERLQICVLALLAIFPVVIVGWLLVVVGPPALAVISAYNLVAWLALCVLWFLRDGWRVMTRAVIHAIVKVDRMIGVALGEDNQILHNFVRVVITVIGLAAALALLASGFAIFP
ncbi:MAG: hypothetical protein ABI619_13070, partial [Betaproteobacteria bacterium]